jgi:anti-sigma factor (TIGR02949 family)
MSWMDDLRRALALARARSSEPEPDPPGGISCHDAAERIFEWLDGELDEEMAPRVAEHLQTCARCYPFLRFEEAFREAVERAARAARGAGPAPAGLGDRIRGAIDTGEGGGDPPG